MLSVVENVGVNPVLLKDPPFPKFSNSGVGIMLSVVENVGIHPVLLRDLHIPEF